MFESLRHGSIRLFIIATARLVNIVVGSGRVYVYLGWVHLSVGEPAPKKLVLIVLAVAITLGMDKIFKILFLVFST